MYKINRHITNLSEIDLYNNSTLKENNRRQWNLEGQVVHLGNPCPPNSKFFSVPPCTGPYSNYEVKIFDEDTKKFALKIKTDSSGKFKALLEPGSYVIHTEAGFSKVKANHFIVERDKILKLPTLYVYTGRE